MEARGWTSCPRDSMLMADVVSSPSSTTRLMLPSNPSLTRAANSACLGSRITSHVRQQLRAGSRCWCKRQQNTNQGGDASAYSSYEYPSGQNERWLEHLDIEAHGYGRPWSSSLGLYLCHQFLRSPLLGNRTPASGTNVPFIRLRVTAARRLSATIQWPAVVEMAAIR